MTSCPHCGHNLTADTPVSAGEWRIDPRQGVFYAGKLVTRRNAWVQIMHTLADAGGRVVSSEALLNRASDSYSLSTISAQIVMLRKHLADLGLPSPIASHRQSKGLSGYRWEAV